MQPRIAMVIATALTAFVLVLILGVTFSLTPQVDAVNPSPTPTDTASATNAPTQTSTDVPTNTATATATNTAQNSFLSVAQISQLALHVTVGGKLSRTPELVNYKGQMAYEIVLNKGVAYFDAFTGQVLYDGTHIAPTQTLLPSPTTEPTSSDPVSYTNSDGSNGGQKSHHTQQSTGASQNPPPPPNPVPNPRPTRKHHKDD